MPLFDTACSDKTMNKIINDLEERSSSEFPYDIKKHLLLGNTLVATSPITF